MSDATMKAAVLTGPKTIEIKQIPVPAVTPGTIKIAVSACGVCGSDVHMWKAGKGWNPDLDGHIVMGHEFCGVVTDPGDSSFQAGDRVVFWANLYCGVCDMCLSGQEHLCRDVNGTNYIGFVCNGAYAEQFVGKAKNAYKLPDTVSDVAAAVIDPLMVAYHAVKHHVMLHDTVFVAGSGIIGQFIGKLAKAAGASLVVMSKINDAKIEKSRQIGDIDAYIDGADPDRTEKLTALSHGGFDVAFEAVGAAAALETCVDAVKPGANVVMIGNTVAPTIPFSMNRTVLKEVSLIGSVSCTRQEFTETIDLIAGGLIDPEPYVSEIIPLEQLQQAFERLTDDSDKAVKFVVSYK